MNHTARLGLLGLAMALSACSVLENDKIDYKSATQGATLEVPPDLTQLSRENRYAVPGSAVSAAAYQAGQNTKSSTTSGAAATKIGDVRIERNGAQRWLVIDRPADQLWDPVREYWLENGFNLVVDQADLGILETDWAENRAKLPQDVIRATLGKVFDSLYSTGERDKFRTRLERNAAGGTEIYVTHRGIVEVYTSTSKDSTVWQPRAADGRWMAERWLKSAPAATASSSSATTAQASAPLPASPAAPAWRVRLGELAVDEGSMAFADRAQPRPVALNLSALSLQARNLALDGGKPEAFQLSARVAARRGNAGFVESRGNAGIVESRGNAGKLDYRGTLTPQPFATQGRLEASRLPLHALDGYLADRFAIELLHAEAGFRGQVAMAQSARGTTLRVSGDAAIDELRANSTAAATPKTADQVGEELLAWKSLGLRGLSVALAPDTAPRVEVKETSLADFFARITINENGRINLSDIAKSPAQVNNTPPAADTAPAAPVAQAPSSPPDTPASTANATASASTALPPSPATPPDPLAPVVVFGPVSLVNGKVLFSDFFIKPNYSADLTELTGKLSAFSSQPAGSEPVLADLELRGRAEGSASLEITGKLNPLAKPLALDIQGKVRDLELPPLTPYSVKYAGHGIERGKLSMDVSYKVLPNGQLTASNKLVLNQLTFGDPVEGAPNSLPVKLAVALLSDSRGVIDLDLPISGSLNDPQFSLGPVIFKAIVNLIVKAITAPFTLLASAFGGDGGQDMSHVAFAPGSARLDAKAREQLDKVAKALADRPQLKLTVVGTARLEAEREGYRRERLKALVLAERRGDAAPAPAGAASDAPPSAAASAPETGASGAQPAGAAAPSANDVTADADYPQLLRRLYRRADIPGRPRNAIGLLRDVPVPEMEALLMAHIEVGEDAMRQLAVQRGVAVKDYLAAQKLPAERLFLGAARTGGAAAAQAPASAASAPPGAWSPRAELALATK